MTKKDRALWAACRLHRILSYAHRAAKASSIPALTALRFEQRALERCCRLLDKARDRGWTNAVEVLRGRLYSCIASVHHESANYRPARIAGAPALADILAEIRSLSDEFDKVEIKPKEQRIQVTTDAITLQEVELGAFSIQLHMDRLARQRDVSAFVIVALRPHCAAGDSSCTHPHVSDQSLCAGDATVPIASALAEGRIADAFQLVSRVLHTYNASSPYVSLSEWEGRACDDCGSTTSNEGLYYCSHCDRDVCDDCMRSCDRCEQLVCAGCLIRYDDERLCPTCDGRRQSEDAAAEQECDDPDEPSVEDPQPFTETIDEHSHAHCPNCEPRPTESAGRPTE